MRGLHKDAARRALSMATGDPDLLKTKRKELIATHQK
jgi:hypothetical protein